jgi:transketolase
MNLARIPGMRDSVVRAISETAAENSDLILITGDLGFGVLTDFADRFPNQFVNAGVAEQNMTMLAAGLALEGCKVITYSIGNFATLRCLEQIRNDVCYHNLDVTVVSVGGGFSYGQLGMSHFATEDLAIMRALPELSVVAPCNPESAYGLTHQLMETPGPKYLRVDKGSAQLPEDVSIPVLGEPRMIREGDDSLVVATGGIISEALEAADILDQKGLSLGVLEVHTLKPLDEDMLAGILARYRRIVTVEEHVRVGGLGGLVCEVVLGRGLPITHVLRLGIDDCYPTVVGDQRYLRAEYELSASAIANAVDNILD